MKIKPKVEPEKRFVAFLDVLGWRDYITRATEDPVSFTRLVNAVTDIDHTTQSRLNKKLRTGATVRKTLKARYSQFSDSIVISAEFGFGLFGFFLEVLAVIRGFLFHGLLVRGGVAFGSMFHDGNVALGPALTRAYELEQNHAIYPRVVLDYDWKKYELPWSPMLDAIDGADNDLISLHILRRDPDGCVFLDYLYPLVPPLHTEVPGFDQPEMFMIPAKPIIENGLEQFRYQPVIFAKYRWLADYFNQTASDLAGSRYYPIRYDLYG